VGRLQVDSDFFDDIHVMLVAELRDYRHLQTLGDLRKRMESLEFATRPMFYKIVLENVKHMRLEPNKDLAIGGWAEHFLGDLNRLNAVPAERDSGRQYVTFESVADAFSSPYVDIDNLVLHYSRKLRTFSKKWAATPVKYNAPYTSLVNSSMTGKSRFEKQLCLHDPVLYFCFRCDTSGYPPATEQSVIHFFENPFRLKSHFAKGTAVAWIEDNFFIAHILFFASYFEQVRLFLSDVAERDKQQRRMDLWNLLAEPARSNKSGADMSKKSEKFWTDVFKSLKPFEFQVLDEEDALTRVKTAYEPLLPLLCDTNDPAEHVLILVFDEARALTERCLDGKQSVNSSGTTQFRILRRALRSIGKRCRHIFSIFTDTSSRVANFQPRGDTDSSREAIKEAPCPQMFPPIVILPTVDVAAEDLQATCDPKEVQSVHRLMSFGRVAWCVMATNTSPGRLLQLAISKLMRRQPDNLTELFCDPSPSDARKFLACLGPRLALQIGSFCQDARELVASHMMFLEHVGDDHEQLFTRYLSEPILAEASARATAEHGWDAPLETLLFKVLHGVVDAGFRGELVTKALLCIAMEDAQQPPTKTAVTELEKGKDSAATSIVTESEKGDANSESLSREPSGRGTMASSVGSNSEAMSREISGRGSMASSAGYNIVDEGSSECRNSDLPSGERDIGEVWHYSKVVTVSRFLDALLQQPSDKVLKRKHPGDDGPHVNIGPPDGAFVQKYLVPALKPRSTPDENTTHLTPEMQKRYEDFLHGYVFFNHFIRAEETLRPSLLVKAWNRNGAIMCEVGASGVDFVIPVIMPGSEARVEATKLGKCTSEWTTEQEEAASKILSYILIQTKNRKVSSAPLRTEEFADCFPLDESLSKRPNFVDHSPQNPFLSILLELGMNHIPRGEKSVQFYWTRSSLWDAMNERTTTLEKKRQLLEEGNHHGSRARMAYQNAEWATQAATGRYNLASLQIPLVVYGRAFKCLESRPNTKRTLGMLLTAALDPVTRLAEPEKNQLLRSRYLRSMKSKDKAK
jgi:hypothetical protein